MSEVATQVITPTPALPSMPLGRVGLADVMFDENKYRQVQRVAKIFHRSGLIPAAIRGQNEDEGIANIILAFALALEMRENPLIVMQNVFFVKGTPGWKTQYVIAKANRAGVFRGRIRWVVEKGAPTTITKREKTGWDSKEKKPIYHEERRTVDNIHVTAVATLAETGDEVSASVDLAMAEAEGWTENLKYHTMPEHMLKWRSAAHLIRLYAPEVMLGYSTAEELEAMPAAPPEPAPRRLIPSSTAALSEALDIEAEAHPAAEPSEQDLPLREPGEE